MGELAKFAGKVISNAKTKKQTDLVSDAGRVCSGVFIFISDAKI